MKNVPRTKIICSIGPASSSKTILQKLIKAGMNVARFNFKHGEHDWVREVAATIRNLEQEMGIPVALLADLQGPDIRTGDFKYSDFINLQKGQSFFLTNKKGPGSQWGVYFSMEKLSSFIKKDDDIYLDDGSIHLKVEKVTTNKVDTRVHKGGRLGQHKGVNIHGVRPHSSSLTEKDKKDVDLAIALGFEFIALSFVESKEDVLTIKKYLEKKKQPPSIKIVSKIESKQGVSNADDIISISDGVMIARGDLGIELPLEEVPSYQKILIEKCNERSVPVITATQMLDSMEHNPYPTRAETSDVANAVLDNTDALMLSGETAIGKFPDIVVRTMNRIITYTEKQLRAGKLLSRIPRTEDGSSISEAVAFSAVQLSKSLGAKLILTITHTGTTAKKTAKYRPSCPIITISPYPEVHKSLLLSRGIMPQGILSKEKSRNREAMHEALLDLKKQNIVKTGDLVVVTSGFKDIHMEGDTNLVFVHKVD